VTELNGVPQVKKEGVIALVFWKTEEELPVSDISLTGAQVADIPKIPAQNRIMPVGAPQPVEKIKAGQDMKILPVGEPELIGIDKPRRMCTKEMKSCTDGSSVARSGPNCEFAACPGEAGVCKAGYSEAGRTTGIVKLKKGCYKSGNSICCESADNLHTSGNYVGSITDSSVVSCEEAANLQLVEMEDELYYVAEGLMPEDEFNSRLDDAQKILEDGYKSCEDAGQAFFDSMTGGRLESPSATPQVVRLEDVVAQYDVMMNGCLQGIKQQVDAVLGVLGRMNVDGFTSSVNVGDDDSCDITSGGGSSQIEIEEDPIVIVDGWAVKVKPFEGSFPDCAQETAGISGVPVDIIPNKKTGAESYARNGDCKEGDEPEKENDKSAGFGHEMEEPWDDTMVTQAPNPGVFFCKESQKTAEQVLEDLQNKMSDLVKKVQQGLNPAAQPPAPGQPQIVGPGQPPNAGPIGVPQRPGPLSGPSATGLFGLKQITGAQIFGPPPPGPEMDLCEASPQTCTSMVKPIGPNDWLENMGKNANDIKIQANYNKARMYVPDQIDYETSFDQAEYAICPDFIDGRESPSVPRQQAVWAMDWAKSIFDRMHNLFEGDLQTAVKALNYAYEGKDPEQDTKDKQQNADKNFDNAGKDLQKAQNDFKNKHGGKSPGEVLKGIADQFNKLTGSPLPGAGAADMNANLQGYMRDNPAMSGQLAGLSQQLSSLSKDPSLSALNSAQQAHDAAQQDALTYGSSSAADLAYLDKKYQEAVKSGNTAEADRLAAMAKRVKEGKATPEDKAELAKRQQEQMEEARRIAQFDPLENSEKYVTYKNEYEVREEELVVREEETIVKVMIDYPCQHDAAAAAKGLAKESQKQILDRRPMLKAAGDAMDEIKERVAEAMEKKDKKEALVQLINLYDKYMAILVWMEDIYYEYVDTQEKYLVVLGIAVWKEKCCCKTAQGQPGEPPQDTPKEVEVPKVKEPETGAPKPPTGPSLEEIEIPPAKGPCDDVPEKWQADSEVELKKKLDEKNKELKERFDKDVKQCTDSAFDKLKGAMNELGIGTVEAPKGQEAFTDVQKRAFDAKVDGINADLKKCLDGAKSKFESETGVKATADLKIKASFKTEGETTTIETGYEGSVGAGYDIPDEWLDCYELKFNRKTAERTSLEIDSLTQEFTDTKKAFDKAKSDFTSLPETEQTGPCDEGKKLRKSGNGYEWHTPGKSNCNEIRKEEVELTGQKRKIDEEFERLKDTANRNDFVISDDGGIDQITAPGATTPLLPEDFSKELTKKMSGPAAAKLRSEAEALYMKSLDLASRWRELQSMKEDCEYPSAASSDDPCFKKSLVDLLKSQLDAISTSLAKTINTKAQAVSRLPETTPSSVIEDTKTSLIKMAETLGITLPKDTSPQSMFTLASQLRAQGIDTSGLLVPYARALITTSQIEQKKIQSEVNSALDSVKAPGTNEDKLASLSQAIMDTLARSGRFSTNDIASALTDPVKLGSMLMDTGIPLEESASIAQLYLDYAIKVDNDKLNKYKQDLDTKIAKLSIKDCLAQLGDLINQLADAEAESEAEAGAGPTGALITGLAVSSEEIASLQDQISKKKEECDSLKQLSSAQQKELTETRFERSMLDLPFKPSETQLQQYRDGLMRQIISDSNPSLSSSEIDKIMSEPQKAYTVVTTYMKGANVDPSMTQEIETWRDIVKTEASMSAAKLAIERAKEIMTTSGLSDLLKSLTDRKIGIGYDPKSGFIVTDPSKLTGEEKMILKFASLQQSIGLLTVTNCNALAGLPGSAEKMSADKCAEYLGNVLSRLILAMKSAETIYDETERAEQTEIIRAQMNLVSSAIDKLNNIGSAIQQTLDLLVADWKKGVSEPWKVRSDLLRFIDAIDPGVGSYLKDIYAYLLIEPRQKLIDSRNSLRRDLPKYAGSRAAKISSQLNSVESRLLAVNDIYSWAEPGSAMGIAESKRANILSYIKGNSGKTIEEILPRGYERIQDWMLTLTDRYKSQFSREITEKLKSQGVSDDAMPYMVAAEMAKGRYRIKMQRAMMEEVSTLLDELLEPAFDKKLSSDERNLYRKFFMSVAGSYLSQTNSFLSREKGRLYNQYQRGQLSGEELSEYASLMAEYLDMRSSFKDMQHEQFWRNPDFIEMLNKPSRFRASLASIFTGWDDYADLKAETDKATALSEALREFASKSGTVEERMKSISGKSSVELGDASFWDISKKQLFPSFAKLDETIAVESDVLEYTGSKWDEYINMMELPTWMIGGPLAKGIAKSAGFLIARGTRASATIEVIMAAASKSPFALSAGRVGAQTVGFMLYNRLQNVAIEYATGTPLWQAVKHQEWRPDHLATEAASMSIFMMSANGLNVITNPIGRAFGYLTRGLGPRLSAQTGVAASIVADSGLQSLITYAQANLDNAQATGKWLSFTDYRWDVTFSKQLMQNSIMGLTSGGVRAQYLSHLQHRALVDARTTSTAELNKIISELRAQADTVLGSDLTSQNALRQYGSIKAAEAALRGELIRRISESDTGMSKGELAVAVKAEFDAWYDAQREALRSQYETTEDSIRRAQIAESNARLEVEKAMRDVAYYGERGEMYAASQALQRANELRTEGYKLSLERIKAELDSLYSKVDDPATRMVVRNMLELQRSVIENLLKASTATTMQERIAAMRAANSASAELATSVTPLLTPEGVAEVQRIRQQNLEETRAGINAAESASQQPVARPAAVTAKPPAEVGPTAEEMNAARSAASVLRRRADSLKTEASIKAAEDAEAKYQELVNNKAEALKNAYESLQSQIADLEAKLADAREKMSISPESLELSRSEIARAESELARLLTPEIISKLAEQFGREKSEITLEYALRWGAQLSYESYSDPAYAFSRAADKVKNLRNSLAETEGSIASARKNAEEYSKRLTEIRYTELPTASRELELFSKGPEAYISQKTGITVTPPKVSPPTAPEVAPSKPVSEPVFDEYKVLPETQNTYLKVQVDSDGNVWTMEDSPRYLGKAFIDPKTGTLTYDSSVDAYFNRQYAPVTMGGLSFLQKFFEKWSWNKATKKSLQEAKPSAPQLDAPPSRPLPSEGQQLFERFQQKYREAGGSQPDISKGFGTMVENLRQAVSALKEYMDKFGGQLPEDQRSRYDAGLKTLTERLRYLNDLDVSPASKYVPDLVSNAPKVKRIVDFLGRGTFGSVFSAEVEGIEGLVAIKILRPKFDSKEYERNPNTPKAEADIFLSELGKFDLARRLGLTTLEDGQIVLLEGGNLAYMTRLLPKDYVKFDDLTPSEAASLKDTILSNLNAALKKMLSPADPGDNSYLLFDVALPGNVRVNRKTGELVFVDVGVLKSGTRRFSSLEEAAETSTPDQNRWRDMLDGINSLRHGVELRALAGDNAEYGAKPKSPNAVETAMSDVATGAGAAERGFTNILEAERAMKRAIEAENTGDKTGAAKAYREVAEYMENLLKENPNYSKRSAAEKVIAEATKRAEELGKTTEVKPAPPKEQPFTQSELENLKVGKPFEPSRYKDLPNVKVIEGASKVGSMGDVQGNYDLMLKAMQRAGYVDSNGNWVGGSAVFVFVGDMIDAGTGAKPSIDFIRKLQSQAEKAGGKVIAIRGNHDQMMPDSLRLTGSKAEIIRQSTDEWRTAYREGRSTDLEDWWWQGGKETAESFLRSGGVKIEGMSQQQVFDAFKQLMETKGQDYLDWFEALPYAAKVNDVLFVHGSPDFNARTLEDLGATPKSQHDMMWDRDWESKTGDIASLKARLGVSGIVYGHNAKGSVVVVGEQSGRQYAGDNALMQQGLYGINFVPRAGKAGYALGVLTFDSQGVRLTFGEEKVGKESLDRNLKSEDVLKADRDRKLRGESAPPPSLASVKPLMPDIQRITSDLVSAGFAVDKTQAAKITSILDKVSKGQLTADEARSQIFELTMQMTMTGGGTGVSERINSLVQDAMTAGIQPSPKVQSPAGSVAPIPSRITIGQVTDAAKVGEVVEIVYLDSKGRTGYPRRVVRRVVIDRIEGDTVYITGYGQSMPIKLTDIVSVEPGVKADIRNAMQSKVPLTAEARDTLNRFEEIRNVAETESMGGNAGADRVAVNGYWERDTGKIGQMGNIQDIRADIHKNTFKYAELTLLIQMQTGIVLEIGGLDQLSQKAKDNILSAVAAENLRRIFSFKKLRTEKGEQPVTPLEVQAPISPTAESSLPPQGSLVPIFRRTEGTVESARIVSYYPDKVNVKILTGGREAKLPISDLQSRMKEAQTWNNIPESRKPQAKFYRDNIISLVQEYFAPGTSAARKTDLRASLQENLRHSVSEVGWTTAQLETLLGPSASGLIARIMSEGKSGPTAQAISDLGEFNNYRTAGIAAIAIIALVLGSVFLFRHHPAQPVSDVKTDKELRKLSAKIGEFKKLTEKLKEP
jgi:hypothetical protein